MNIGSLFYPMFTKTVENQKSLAQVFKNFFFSSRIFDRKREYRTENQERLLQQVQLHAVTCTYNNTYNIKTPFYSTDLLIVAFCTCMHARILFSPIIPETVKNPKREKKILKTCASGFGFSTVFGIIGTFFNLRLQLKYSFNAVCLLQST